MNIVLDHVSAGYDGKDVIFDVTLNFEKNKNYCLLGPNGCGKTTLLRVMAGLLPSTGNVLIENTNIKRLKRREIAQKIAVMSQISTIYFPYTVEETVLLGRYLQTKRNMFSSYSKEDKAFVHDCLQKTGVYDLRNTEIDKLSGGQKQRVFLAQTLAQQPDIILLDEPTNHLDIKHQIQLIDYLKEWSKESNHAVIGVFHDINLALRLSQNLVFMKEGHVMGAGDFNAIITKDFLQNIYQMDVVEYMTDAFKKWNEVL